MSELQTVSAESLPVASATPTIAVPLVLIADANQRSRARRAQQLEGRGFRVAVARTGFETIVKASCHLPDMILVDGSLGDGGVKETTELLSTCPATAHIPIVLLTPGRRLPSRVFAAAAR
jgi:CheY-like chemotaxis protein